MKQRTAEILIVIAVILLNVWLMMGDGGHSGRGLDYYEAIIDDSAYADD